VATALWSSSSAMTAIIGTLNSAYDIEEGRPWWKVQLTALLLTLGVALFILVSFVTLEPHNLVLTPNAIHSPAHRSEARESSSPNSYVPYVPHVVKGF